MGTGFLRQRIQPNRRPPEVETTISFGEDGQFGGNVGCNGFGAEYEVSGSEITFDAIVSTMMYCEAVAGQESAVIGALSGNPVTFQLDGDTLTLTSADGTSVVCLPASDQNEETRYQTSTLTWMFLLC
jgi:heat shock protein HslJ